MFVRSICSVLIAALLSLGCTPPEYHKTKDPTDAGDENPCEDKLFLDLQKVPVDSMTTRQYEYFMKKSEECVQYQTRRKRERYLMIGFIATITVVGLVFYVITSLNSAFARGWGGNP